LCLFSFFFFLSLPPLTSTLFPYTTLFRSLHTLPFLILVVLLLLVQIESALQLFVHMENTNNQNHLIAYVDCLQGNREIARAINRSEEHTSELQSRFDLVCRLLLEKKNNII